MTYTYDALNQLTAEHYSTCLKGGAEGEAEAGGLSYDTITYSYDTRGNILSKTYMLGETTVETITYGYADPKWKDLLTAYNGNAITYDTIGNPLTWHDGSTMTWHHGRQLYKHTQDGITSTYVYNADGIRTSKTVGSVTTNYYVVDGSLRRLTNGTNTLRFVYGNGLSSVIFNGTEYWYVFNAQGDIIGLINASGSYVVQYTYDSWGKILSKTGSLADTLGTLNPFRYRGYIYDEETGLYYVSSRYYDPVVGRWLNADTPEALTVGFNNNVQYNLFTYCFNNPINLIDETGTWPSWATKLVVGTAVIAAAAVLTVATAGTGTALACFAVGALKGATVGAAVGAATGAATGAVTHRVTTGSWEGAGEAALEGAADGYMSGAITGFVSGGLSSNACFVAGTSILTSTGKVVIESIKVGDYVWATNPETGETALKQVKQTFVNETSELVHITVKSEEIVCTTEHPFYSPVKGWTAACNLRQGDILVTVNGKLVIVEQVQHEILESPIKVYNFEVADFHTYYVGDTSILVHNVCKNPGRAGKQARLRELANDDKLSSALRGEIKRDINMIARGQRRTIRVPSGYQLSHRIGYSAKNGFSYAYSDLQTIIGHKLHHYIFGR